MERFDKGARDQASTSLLLPCRRIAVIGAGIIGLSCAYRLQTELPHTKVTVISDKFSPHLLSDGAAGLWDPYAISGPDAARAVQWSLDTYSYLMGLGLGPDAIQSGVAPIPYYWPTKQPDAEIPSYFADVFHLARLSQADKDRFTDCNGGLKFTSVMCEPKIYLPWMMKKFIAAGGKVVQKKVTSLYLICGDYDLVVNCTGWGAKELTGDTTFIPIRGQVIKVRPKVPVNSSFSYRTADGRRTYVLPGFSDTMSHCEHSENAYCPCSNATAIDCLVCYSRDLVTLGGTYVVGDSSTDVREDVKQKILRDTTNYDPRLKDAEVVLDWCGSRPSRKTGIRLEIDDSFHSQTKVIHNYGHGGIGISLHWGCAAEVLQLARQELGHVVYHKSKL